MCLARPPCRSLKSLLSCNDCTAERNHKFRRFIDPATRDILKRVSRGVYSGERSERALAHGAGHPPCVRQRRCIQKNTGQRPPSPYVRRGRSKGLIKPVASPWRTRRRNRQRSAVVNPVAIYRHRWRCPVRPRPRPGETQFFTGSDHDAQGERVAGGSGSGQHRCNATGIVQCSRPPGTHLRKQQRERRGGGNRHQNGHAGSSARGPRRKKPEKKRSAPREGQRSCATGPEQQRQWLALAVQMRHKPHSWYTAARDQVRSASTHPRKSPRSEARDPPSAGHRGADGRKRHAHDWLSGLRPAHCSPKRRSRNEHENSASDGSCAQTRPRGVAEGQLLDLETRGNQNPRAHRPRRSLGGGSGRSRRAREHA